MGNHVELKQKMEARRDELQVKLQRLKADISKPHSSDWSEQAQERENDEVLNQLGGGAEQELHDINNALERMKRDEYGVCSDCNQEIALERLAIKPEVAQCTGCAK